MDITDPAQKAYVETLRNIVPLLAAPRICQDALDFAVAAGMIPKSKLVHGEYYAGYCRNAWVARWDGSRGLFVYQRHKWGATFAESIEHPEDDTGFDVFIPVGVIVPEQIRIVTDEDLISAR